MKIENGRYWQIGIELVSGCTPCSPGCEHCWSAAMEHRLNRNGWGPSKRSGRLTYRHDARFNGQIVTHPDRLKRFNTRKPKVFSIWNDLFHEAVPFQFVLATLIHAVGKYDNKYLILSKRPHRMVAFFKWMDTEADLTVEIRDCFYFGLTVCNQQEWDEKERWFLQIPGKKFISHEPALGEIHYGEKLCLIDCLISGGGTGPGARPSHPDIFRSDRDQCAAVGVPFFFKQWGEYIPVDDDKTGGHKHLTLIGRQWIDRIGRKKAGRLLDGQEYNDLPWRVL